jgi:hypothetical protein
MPKKDNLDKAAKLRIKDLLQDVIDKILRPLGDVFHDGVDIVYSDGYKRNCYPRLSSWIADHKEYITLFDMKSSSCPRCEIPFDQIGIPTPTHFPKRDWGMYEDIKDALKLATTVSERKRFRDLLDKRGLHETSLALSNIQGIVLEDIHKPDILHCLYLGLMKYVIAWVVDFVKEHKRYSDFDRLWLSYAPYPGFRPFTLIYSQTTQWQGKEMRNAGKILAATLAAALASPKPSEKAAFTRAQECVQAFITWSLFCKYKMHTDSTLAQMEESWNTFYQLKDVFVKYRNKKDALKRATS